MSAKNGERLEYFFFFNTRRNLSEMVKFVTIGHIFSFLILAETYQKWLNL